MCRCSHQTIPMPSWAKRWSWDILESASFVRNGLRSHLFVGSVVVGLELLDCEGALADGLMQQPIERDGCIVRPEDLHTEVVHQLLHTLVQVLSVKRVKQLVFGLLLCRHTSTHLGTCR